MNSNTCSFSRAGLQPPFEINFCQGGIVVEINSEIYGSSLPTDFTERIANRTDDVQMISAVCGCIDRTLRLAEAQNRVYCEEDARSLLALTDAMMRRDAGDATASLAAQRTGHADRLPELTGVTVKPLAYRPSIAEPMPPFNDAAEDSDCRASPMPAGLYSIERLPWCRPSYSAIGGLA